MGPSGSIGLVAIHSSQGHPSTRGNQDRCQPTKALRSGALIAGPLRHPKIGSPGQGIAGGMAIPNQQLVLPSAQLELKQHQDYGCR